MASMRDIKRRKGSIQSTQQITKAMKLVSTVKLQRARANAERSREYFHCMYETVRNILGRCQGMEHRYLRQGDTSAKAVIAITSNRGLAGGYNSNIVKLVARHEGWKKEDLRIYAVGRKGKEAFQRGGLRIEADLSEAMEEPSFRDAMKLGESVLAAYEAGEVGEVYLAYTAFKNTVSHVPTLLKLLPLDREEILAQEGDGGKDAAPMNCEPEDEEALDRIIPKYVDSLIYGGLIESLASENGARMQAMDNATSNAEEMIDDLTLMYNRARQSSITQELTEIIAGAEAIS